MTFQLDIDVDRAMATLGAVTKTEVESFRKAFRGTAQLVSEEMKRRGDADILKGGNFSQRWPDDFATPVTFGEDRAVVEAKFLTIPYAHIHEFGGTIRGKPLLWIPLSFGDAPGTGIGSGKVPARDYPGRLFRVERAGKNPLLFSETGPQYVGVKHVTLRPRWNIRRITANVVRTQLARFFYSIWQEKKK